jgi:hypothetical protein
MNTNQLIDVLSAGLEPVPLGELRRTLTLALASGGVAAFSLMSVTAGPRPDIVTVAALKWLTLKLLFALRLIPTAASSLIRSLRPAAGR